MFKNTFNKFIDIYNGPPLNVFITGGGFSLYELLRIPGGSKFINKIYSPYSNKAIEDFIKENIDKINKNNSSITTVDFKLFKSCSENACKLYYEAIKEKDSVSIAITSSLVTNREQKAENQSFINIDGKIYHIKFNKYYDRNQYCFYYRKRQDEVIAEFVLFILMNGKIEEFPKDYYANIHFIKLL